MMKRLTGILLATLCLLSLCATAYADHFDGQAGWTVTYTTDGKMVSNFHTSDYNDPLKGLQPGDDMTLTVTLKSDNAQRADWYMTNKVLHSLEDRSKSGSSGGAYTYTLTYIGPTQTRVLYDSDTVGGDSVSAEGAGLHEATSALKDYFYLDSLESGQTGRVVLNVALDGESQGNRYQDTMADLQMNFAVEQRNRRVVMTGDDTNLTPLYVVALLSGIGVLVLAIRDLRARKQGRHSGKRERRSET